jgi:hypothetical protein
LNGKTELLFFLKFLGVSSKIFMRLVYVDMNDLNKFENFFEYAFGKKSVDVFDHFVSIVRCFFNGFRRLIWHGLVYMTIPEKK